MIAEIFTFLNSPRSVRHNFALTAIKIMMSLLLTHRFVSEMGFNLSPSTKIDLNTVMHFVLSYKMIVFMVMYFIAYILVFHLKNIIDFIIIFFFSNKEKVFPKSVIVDTLVRLKYIEVSKNRLYYKNDNKLGKQVIKYLYQEMNPIFFDNVIVSTVNSYFSIIFVGFYLISNVQVTTILPNCLNSFFVIGFYIFVFVSFLFLYGFMSFEKHIESIFIELSENDKENF